MPEFFFHFGYSSPGASSIDHESIGVFGVRATSEEEAVEWGTLLADWYVAALYNDASPGRWSQAGYAAWLETHLEPELEDKVVHINQGQYPDLDSVKTIFSD